MAHIAPRQWTATEHARNAIVGLFNGKYDTQVIYVGSQAGDPHGPHIIVIHMSGREIQVEVKETEIRRYA